MLKELVEKLEAMAVRAHGVEVVTPPAEPRHHYAIQDAAGVLGWFEADPQPRDHQAFSLDTLVAFAVKSQKEDVKSQKKEGDGVVWYGRAGVVLLVNDADRRDRVTLPLALSAPLTYLLGCEVSRKPVSQANLVSLLRTTLARCVRGNLLEIIRKVNFNSTSTGHGDLQHGKSSIGKNLQAELSGTGVIPETVTFDVPIFAAHVYTVQPVECALEIAPETQTFTLVPIPGDIERAIALGEAVLGSRLAGLKDVAPVFYGEPGTE